MDRISGLPKAILHDILARLPDKDSARTSVLSKAWRETWFTFPILSICSAKFLRSQYISLESCHSKTDKLIDYVGRRLLSLHDRGLAIKEFKLTMDYVDHEYMSHHLDLWMKMAIESGCQVLQLRLPGGFLRVEYSQDRFYDLPLSVTESKSLTKLGLRGEIRVNQSFLTHSIKLYSLRKLTLCNLLFTHEGIIDHLISHCPVIEDLTVSNCGVYNPLSIGNSQELRIILVKSLFLHGLQKLKKVSVQGIHEIYIDAPNLEFFQYSANHPDASFKLNLDTFTNLIRLCLWNLKITDVGDEYFLELFSKLPFLQSLELSHCSLPQRINIISAELKVFKLYDCSNLKEVNIDAPNLLSLDYHGEDKPVISFVRSSNQLQATVFTAVDYSNFYSLRDFIQNIPQKILASLSLFVIRPMRDNPYIMPALEVSCTPPSIKHLVLTAFSIPNNESLYGPLMNCVLSSCFPKTISIKYFGPYAFIEFFYEMLMGSKKGECYCSSGNRKCWWHALKIAKISCSFMSNENVDLKAMLNASPKSFHANVITFSLEL